ncbi:MAG: DUF488 domain-containing protein [Candidatus Micrarchaeales archaeon]|nr:DUF488 domain-containing protein [Candidatus Micrarchaeales archaeon]
MKLQKVFSRKLNKKEYVKWLIIVPPKDVEELTWKDGQKLKTKVEKGNLIITISKEPSYEEFKSKILALLNSRQQGFIWQEIKERLSLEQKVPNNKWVRKLEKEINLRRMKYDGAIHWYLDKKGITVYTIGYEGKKVEEIVDVLKKHDIKGLVDVRELALSRKNGFSKSTLSAILKENGIVYRHYQELGSPRALRHQLWNEHNYDEFFKKYSEWLSSPDAKTYLEDLEGLAHIRNTAILCFEKDVEKCHRSIIKKRLIQDGFKVVDL